MQSNPSAENAPGRGRHDDAAHAEFLGDRRGMHRAGAAERQQRELAEIDAAPRREHAHLVGHAHVDDAADAGRGFGDAHSHRLGDFCFERDARGIGIEFLAAAEEIIRIEEAADNVGVGHRRIGAAAAVAHRARIGAGALRADSEEAGAVDPHDRAAAGRDRGEIERRNIELAARHDAFGHFERRAALDKSDVATGAAHVERDIPRASSCGRYALACAPAAGPDSRLCTVLWPVTAAANGITPPFDCIRKRCCVVTPAASRRFSRSAI